MSASYDQAFEFTVLGQEGGFVLSTLEHDSGGKTYAGISRNNFPQWEGWAYVDRGELDSPVLHDLVRDFYYQLIWLRMNLEQLPPRLAALVFDYAVNSGRTIAAKKLQSVLLVKDDGVIGPMTSRAAIVGDSMKVAMRYIATRLDFLNDLRAWEYFSVGWSQRIVHLLNFAAA